VFRRRLADYGNHRIRLVSNSRIVGIDSDRKIVVSEANVRIP
jgi:hypothetical protein